MSADENEEDTQAEDSQSEESGGEEEEKSSQQLAQEKEEESEQAQKEIKELEDAESADDLPQKAEDWPSGPAKYETFGLDDPTYGEGATEKLGPANLERHADGSVSIDGEKVDNPEDYKGDPIQAAVDSNQEDDEDDGDDEDGEQDEGGEEEDSSDDK